MYNANEVLNLIWMKDPYYEEHDEENEWEQCIWCGHFKYADDKKKHYDDCPWLKAYKMME